MIIIGGLVVVGQVFFVTGIRANSFTLAAIGRFIFGIGAESHSGMLILKPLVVTLEALSYWNYQFLPVSLALFVGAKKFGAAVNCILTPYLYNVADDVMPILYVGLGFAILCLVTGIIFLIVEKLAMSGSDQVIQKEHVSLSHVSKFPGIFWFAILYMAFYYAAINAFNTVSSGMGQNRFSLSITTCGILLVYYFVILVYVSYGYCGT